MHTTRWQHHRANGCVSPLGAARAQPPNHAPSDGNIKVQSMCLCAGRLCFRASRAPPPNHASAVRRRLRAQSTHSLPTEQMRGCWNVWAWKSAGLTRSCLVVNSSQTWAWHPFFPWEWWLADLGYVGALGLLYKWKKASQHPNRRPPPDLTPQELFYNNIHEFYRNRVEQSADC